VSAPSLRWLLLATHVPASGSGGGMIRYCVELARALSARPDVDLHVVATPEAEEFFTGLLGPGRVHRAPALPVALRSLVERAGPRLLPVLRQQWDVVHGAKHLVPRSAGAATRVLTVHDMNPLDRPADFGALKRVGLRRPYLDSIADADVLVCVSAATRARLLAWAPDAEPRAGVAHLAASPALLAAEPEAVPELAGRPFVVMVGDSSPRKNLALAFRIWPGVVAARPDAVLAVVGPPSWGPSQLGAAAPLVAGGQVALLGHRSDGELSWLYRNAAAVLCPSQLEGFGLPVVEGEALGVPVLVSDDAAMGEVSRAGTTALSPHDPAAWQAAVLAALDGRLPAAPAPESIRTWADVAAETVEQVRRAR
jgi:glycosyltransferase involved in cell wall biosynthesis